MSGYRAVPFLVAQVMVERGEERLPGLLVNGWWHRDLRAMVRQSVVVLESRVALATALIASEDGVNADAVSTDLLRIYEAQGLLRAVREAWDEEMRRRRLVELQRQQERAG